MKAILIHGMGRTTASMAILSRRLRVRGPRAAWLLFEGEPNDGILAVEETRARDGDEVIEVPALHTFIMNSRRVAEGIVEMAGIH